MKYEHGTNAAYCLDRCRCRDCTDAHAAELDRRNRLVAAGRWDGRTSGDLAREHIAALRASGGTISGIARAAGVKPPTITAITKGASLRLSTQRRILAIDAPPVPKTGTTMIDATGSRRRLQALYCMGWTGHALEATSGITHQLASLLITGQQPRLKKSTAALIESACRTLHATAAPDGTSSRRARARAERNAWAPLMAWDNIDDPNETPNLGKPNHVRGHRPFVDLNEDVTHLADSGCDRDEIADRVHLTWNTIAMAYARHNTPLPITLRRAA